MVEFKKFKIGDLFDVTSGKWLSKVDQQPGTTPFISSSAKNNGIAGYISKDPLFSAGTLTTASHGSVGATFYQDKPYFASSNVNSLSYKYGKLDRKIGLYFVACIQHTGKSYGYSHILSVGRTKAAEIELPVTSTGDPDFAYMARRIDELEAQRIDELEAQRIDELSAYLKVSGLDNVVLTDEEKDALTKKVEWKKFRIGDLFHQVTLKRTKENFNKKKDTSTESTTEFDLPLINAKLGNNGIMYYGRSKDWKSTDLGIDIIQNGAVATGMVYPQPDQVGRLWDAYIIKWNNQNDILNAKHILYLAGCVRQSIRGNYNYQRKATWARVQDDSILLPVTSTGAIDFDYMQHYITAIEKQSIKGVIAYKDKVIATTKKVVSGNV